MVHIIQKSFADRCASFPEVLQQHYDLCIRGGADPIDAMASAIEMSSFILGPHLHVKVFRGPRE